MGHVNDLLTHHVMAGLILLDKSNLMRLGSQLDHAMVDLMLHSPRLTLHEIDGSILQDLGR